MEAPRERGAVVGCGLLAGVHDTDRSISGIAKTTAEVLEGKKYSIDYYQRALGLLQGAEQVTALLTLSKVLELVGRLDDAEARAREALALAEALGEHASPDTLVVVDCLTLWLTNLLMPAEGGAADPQAPTQALLDAIAGARGPVVLVGNEIGLGVIPLGRETRAFVDALGRLNQAVAGACERVTLMAAGLPLTLKAPR